MTNINLEYISNLMKQKALDKLDEAYARISKKILKEDKECSDKEDKELEVPKISVKKTSADTLKNVPRVEAKEDTWDVQNVHKHLKGDEGESAHDEHFTKKEPKSATKKDVEKEVVDDLEKEGAKVTSVIATRKEIGEDKENAKDDVEMLNYPADQSYDKDENDDDAMTKDYEAMTNYAPSHLLRKSAGIGESSIDKAHEMGKPIIQRDIADVQKKSEKLLDVKKSSTLKANLSQEISSLKKLIKDTRETGNLSNIPSLEQKLEDMRNRRRMANESLDESATHYHSVWTKGNDHVWSHHFDADNKEDAAEEARSLRNNREKGDKVKVIRVPKEQADWRKPEHVAAAHKKLNEESLDEKEEGDFGYVAFSHHGKRADIYAKSKYEAHKKALDLFKPPKSKAHMVHVHLAERPDGEQVVHTATESLGENLANKMKNDHGISTVHYNHPETGQNIAMHTLQGKGELHRVFHDTDTNIVHFTHNGKITKQLPKHKEILKQIGKEHLIKEETLDEAQLKQSQLYHKPSKNPKVHELRSKLSHLHDVWGAHVSDAAGTDDEKEKAKINRKKEEVADQIAYHENEISKHLMKEEVEQISEHITKEDGKYVLRSKKTNKHLGTFSSKKAAQRREQQINYFKNQ